MLAMQILDVLNKHSDADHRLTQQDIARLLETEHQVQADRGTIKRNLFHLVDYGYNIEWTEIPRRDCQGEDSSICTDWYIQRLFDESELRLLMDSLFFSRYVPAKAGKDIVRKLETLSSQHFKSNVSAMSGIQEKALTNPQLFFTLAMLDEAIRNHRQVAFTYNSVGLDMKLSPRQDRLGRPIRYLVNPYQLVVANGRHYLVGNHDRHHNISHLRVDRITEIEVVDYPSKPLSQVAGMEKGLSLPTHFAEHIYMFSGPSEQVVFTTPRDMMDSIVDWFGTGVKVRKTDAEMMEVSVTVNKQAMRYWALQYARYVTILAPDDLVQQVRGDLVEAAGRYLHLSADK